MERIKVALIQQWCGHYDGHCGPHEDINAPTLPSVGESPSGWQKTIWSPRLLGSNELWCRAGSNKVLRLNWQWQGQVHWGGILHGADGGVHHSRWKEDHLTCSPQDLASYSRLQAPQVLAGQAQVGQSHLQQHWLAWPEGSLFVTWSSSSREDLQECSWMAQHWPPKVEDLSKCCHFAQVSPLSGAQWNTRAHSHVSWCKCSQEMLWSCPPHAVTDYVEWTMPRPTSICLVCPVLARNSRNTYAGCEQDSRLTMGAPQLGSGQSRTDWLASTDARLHQPPLGSGNSCQPSSQGGEWQGQDLDPQDNPTTMGVLQDDVWTLQCNPAWPPTQSLPKDPWCSNKWWDLM